VNNNSFSTMRIYKSFDAIDRDRPIILNSRSLKLHSRHASRPKRINSRPNRMKRLANCCLRSASSDGGCCCCDCLPKRMNRLESARCCVSASSSGQTVITQSLTYISSKQSQQFYTPAIAASFTVYHLADHDQILCNSSCI